MWLTVLSLSPYSLHLHSSPWISFPTHSCLLLHSFCASLLHLLIIWLTVSFLSPYSLHLHNSPWISFPTHSCLLLHSFCASLLHLLIIWLTVSFLSPYSLHLHSSPWITFLTHSYLLWHSFCDVNESFSLEDIGYKRLRVFFFFLGINTIFCLLDKDYFLYMLISIFSW